MLDAPQARRSYESPVRRQQAEATRRSIVDAGVALLRASSIRDWGALTVRSVAERAGVSERTVYRHFENERRLRDAVLQRLEVESGVDLEHMRLDDVAATTARIFGHVAGYPLDPRPPLDPTLGEANARQRQALLRAVTEHTAAWPEHDRRVAAAALDALWSMASYQRIVADWGLDPGDATRGITWVVGLIEAAIRGDRRP